jgi:hypothetical protein
MYKKQKSKQASVIRLLNFGFYLGLEFFGFLNGNGATEEWDIRY